MKTPYNQNNIMDSLDQLHHILVIEDPSFEREINLDAATYSVGRHSSNDVVLSCQKTSRHHATLLRRTDVKTNKCSYWVLDGDLQGNRSRNGIYINGKKSLVHELIPGDIIQFSGNAQATYKVDQQKAVNLELDNNLDYLDEPEQLNTIPKQKSGQTNTNQTNTNINKETIVITPQVIANSHQAQEYVPEASLTELSPLPIIEIDLYGNITYINSAGIINFKNIHHQKLNHPLLENLISQYNQGHNNIINRKVKIGDKVFEQTAHFLPEKKVIRNYVLDITQQTALEAKSAQNEDLYRKIAQQITEGIILVESATKQIIEVNPACSNLLGYSPAEMLQMNIYELSSESQKFTAVLQQVMAGENSFLGELSLHHHNGDLVQAQVKIDLIGSPTNAKICIVIHSLAAHQQIRPKNQNLLIDISKRDIFYQQLLTAIANSKRTQKMSAVMFCQLGLLPDIQVTIGTEKSRHLLSTLKERLSTCLRAGDTIIHWQEDVFALVLPQISSVDEVAKINQRMQKSIEQSFKIGEDQVTLNSTTGIAIYPQDGTEAEILLAGANTALGRAQKNKSSYQFYDEAMNSQAMVILELETLLQQGLDQEEFKLYYQPQINVDTGKLEAIKALLRWQHPELGLVAPSNFIKSAEKSKLIVPIGEWAIRTACQQNKKWQSLGLPTAKITVSLSSVQFQQPNLTQNIADILGETDLEPQFLELEVNAASLMQNIDHSRHLLNQLAILGVHIAVDGFTAGFSALEYLKQFPLNTLKLDRSLIQELTDSSQDLAIVSALIELGKGFNLRVVAEGVETQEQVNLLRKLNCQQMQGFWFGRPLAAEEAGKLLQLNTASEELELEESKEVKQPLEHHNVSDAKENS